MIEFSNESYTLRIQVIKTNNGYNIFHIKNGLVEIMKNIIILMK